VPNDGSGRNFSHRNAVIPCDGGSEVTRRSSVGTPTSRACGTHVAILVSGAVVDVRIASRLYSPRVV
jgi:hypothetical protein